MAQPINYWCACNIISNKNIVKVRGPIQYGMRYSATRQFFLATTLHLLHRGFCSFYCLFTLYSLFILGSIALYIIQTVLHVIGITMIVVHKYRRNETDTSALSLFF